MRHKAERLHGKPALDLVEEAIHLLRRSPFSVFSTYGIGTLPFLLGFLYFWTDMSQSAFAHSRCAEGALAVAALYLWMKCWHTVFANQLMTQVRAIEPTRWTFGPTTRMIATQCIVQPSSLFVIPVATVLTLPFGWAYAFYQNLSVLGDGAREDIGSVIRESVRQTRIWQAQNHGVVGLLYLFGFFVLLNLEIALFVLPHLLKMMLGIETVFTQSGFHAFNSTFQMTVLCLTYLCLNPILKSAYVLRCFYGESAHTGEDLKVELRSVVQGQKPLAALALAAWLVVGLFSANAVAENTPPASKPPPSVSATELDRSIQEVLNQREYAWRLPREREESKPGKISDFFERVGKWLRHLAKIARRWLDKFDEWLRKYFHKRASQELRMRESTFDWITAAEILLFVLLAAVVCTLVILFWRLWKTRRARSDEILSEAIAPLPDLEEENVVASQLPSNEWLLRAQELMAKGEFRLALRALYLASLATLAQRELIRIAKFKSNHEYERELRRRAHAWPELLDAFADNIDLFERGWYGTHTVTEDILNRFTSNLQRIEAPVAKS